eukprot:scaffold136544_cov148-Phaeocystis_antarctica.AAC.2
MVDQVGRVGRAGVLNHGRLVEREQLVDEEVGQLLLGLRAHLGGLRLVVEGELRPLLGISRVEVARDHRQRHRGAERHRRPALADELEKDGRDGLDHDRAPATVEAARRPVERQAGGSGGGGGGGGGDVCRRVGAAGAVGGGVVGGRREAAHERVGVAERRNHGLEAARHTRQNLLDAGRRRALLALALALDVAIALLDLDLAVLALALALAVVVAVRVAGEARVRQELLVLLLIGVNGFATAATLVSGLGGRLHRGLALVGRFVGLALAGRLGQQAQVTTLGGRVATMHIGTPVPHGRTQVRE